MSVGDEQSQEASETNQQQPSGEAPPDGGNPQQANTTKPVPYWLECASKGAQVAAVIVNMFVFIMIYRQFKINENALDLNRVALRNNKEALNLNRKALNLNRRAIKISEDSFRLTDEATDRVWAAQLIETIYEVVDCPKPDKNDCPPKASFRPREEAAIAYVKLQVERKEKVNLKDANLSGMAFPVKTILSNGDLYADLSNATLSDVELLEAQMQGAKLLEADLSNGKLRGAYLKDSILSRANLQSADLEGANLEGAQFDDADLQTDCEYDDSQGRFPGSAILKGAKLANANFKNAQVCGVDVSGADLSEVKDLTPDQLTSMKGDAHTVLPRGFTRPNPWGSGRP